MTSPSATASLVQRGIAFQSTHPEHRALVNSETARWAERVVVSTGMKLRRGDSAIDRALVAIQEKLFVPGLTLQYVLRKRNVESLVREAIASGYRQLIVIGAGLDSLAFRLAGEVHAIEIDRAETQVIKRKIIGENSGIRLVAADLSTGSLEAVLRTCPQAGTVFLAEAVFLYLTAEDVHRALRAIRCAVPRSRVIFTFFGTRADGRMNFANATFLAGLWLKWNGEPVKWAIDAGAVAEFVAADGFEVRELIRDVDYHEGFRAARGEHIAVVEGR